MSITPQTIVADVAGKRQLTSVLRSCVGSVMKSFAKHVLRNTYTVVVPDVAMGARKRAVGSVASVLPNELDGIPLLIFQLSINPYGQSTGQRQPGK